MKKIFIFSFLALLGLLCGCALDLDFGDEPLPPAQREALEQEAQEKRTQGRQQRETADFFVALESQTRAMEISQLLGDTSTLIQDYNQLGTTFRRLGRQEQAISYHLQALNLAEARLDTSQQAIKNLVVSLNGLGNSHLTLGDNHEAEKCFRRALDGEIALNSHLGMAINYANLGSIKEKQHQYDSAHWYFERSLEENVQAGSTMGQGLCHIYFGNLNQDRNQLQEAEMEYREAYRLLFADKDLWHSIEAVLALSRNLHKQGRNTEALGLADKALSEARQMHSVEHLREATVVKAHLLEDEGNLRESLHYLHQARAWEDSLDANNRQDGIRDLCIRYGIEQSEKKMQELQKAYEVNSRMMRYLTWGESLLLLLALFVLAAVWYAYKIRKERLEDMKKNEAMRTAFFRNITHEFRTPLTLIMGLSDQLKDEELSMGKRLNFISTIQQQGHQLLDLVNELLSFSKLMAGYDKKTWYHGDVVSFIRLGVSSYMDFAHLRNIELHFVTEQESIEMDFVPDYYTKILNNLLGNAFKYTPAGGSIMVKLSLREKHLVIDVIDTGTGFSLEDKQHLFELFYQGRTSEMQGNSGIGLPFVKQMVQHMGGIISVKDNQPHGSDMQIILSMKSNESQAEVKPWTLQDAMSVVPNTSPRTVLNAVEAENECSNESNLPVLLIVEDNPYVSEYIKVVLQTQYRLVTATDGMDALNKASKVLPDAIISDLVMPGMDGYQLCHAIRQSQMLSDVPIIIVSARSEQEDRVKAYEMGADGYLLKPFNPVELSALIARLLTQRKQTRANLQNIIAGNLPKLERGQVAGDQEMTDVRAFLQHLHEVVEQQMVEGDLQLETIASKMALSRSTLARRIKLIAGCAPSAYILQLRLDRARHLLKNDRMTIGEVSLSCGFDDMSYFCRVFRQNYDQTPSQFRASLLEDKSTTNP